LKDKIAKLLNLKKVDFYFLGNDSELPPLVESNLSLSELAK